jgi:hypothetical protein
VNRLSQGLVHLTDRTSRAPTWDGASTRPHEPTNSSRVERLRVPRADQLRESRPTLCALTHATQPFFIFAQSFGASVRYFLVSLSHLVIVNSTIFGILNSVIFSYNEVSHFSYTAQSFYDFVTHFAIMNAAIWLQWTQSFCYSALNHYRCFIGHFSTVNSVIFLQCSVIL